MSKGNRFSNWYAQLSLPLKASFWFAISNLLQKGVSVITTPIFSRLMSEEQYGIYSTYTTWQSLLLIIVSLSLYKSLLNTFVKTDNHDHALSSVVSLSLLITGVWLLIALALLFILPSLLKIPMPLVVCLFLYTLFFPILECWTVKKQFAFEYKSAVIVTLVFAVLSAGLGALSVVFISSVAEARAIPQIIVLCVIGVGLLVSIFRKDKGGFDKKIWAFSLSFCLPLLPHYLSEFVLGASDKLMINYMCSAQDVAIYSIAYSVGSVITLFTSAINSAFAPYQYKMIKAKEFKRLSGVANCVMVFVGIMLFLIMLFGREIILVFGGQKYLASESCVIPICVGLFFNYLFQLFARVQEYFEHKLLVVIPSLLCAILNIVLNLVFIREYGFIAASYTTAICYFLFCILHFVFYFHTCKKEINGVQIYSPRAMGAISLSFLGVSVASFFLKDFLWAKLAFLGIFVVVCVLLRKQIVRFVKTIFRKDKTPTENDSNN